jgi:hypothetical protein
MANAADRPENSMPAQSTNPSNWFGTTQGHHVFAGNTLSAGSNFHVNYYSTTPSPSAAASRPCRVIPFLPNEDLVVRSDIFDRLDALLPPSSPDYHTAALYGLGGSG